MTKKDYKLVAQAINDSIKKGNNIVDLTIALTEKLELENPRFDRDKFLEACWT